MNWVWMNHTTVYKMSIHSIEEAQIPSRDNASAKTGCSDTAAQIR